MTRAKNWTNLAIFLASVLTIAIVVNVFAQRPDFRQRIDSTKTRAYSLSEQTQRLVRNLDGQWTIAMLTIEGETDRAVRRQIDEVLSRFTQASNNISVKRIDPTNPRTLADYESLLTRLRAIYADLTREYEEHLGAGAAAFADLLVFAQQHSGMLDQLVQITQQQGGGAGAQYQQVMQRAQTLALLAEQGETVLEEVAKARNVSDAQPIPDYETARSILAEVLSRSANELYETAESFAAWRDRSEIPVEIRQYAASVRREFEQRASALALAAEPLVHLPPLELSRIGRQLARGEAAIIIGPNRAAVIPSAQLIARSNIRQHGETVTFDQRFRGEQLIASAIQSLLVDHMPMVVFVHAEERSMLRPRDRQIDAVGVASVLAASRFEVKEWIVGEQDQPAAQPGQPVVYVIIPPPQRQGLEPSRRERQLISTAEQLIADGEPVLLSVYPSLLPRLGQPDPWARLAAPLGMNVDTEHVVHESVRAAAERIEIMKGQVVQQYERGHPIAAAVHGQQAYFNLPTPIQLRDMANVRHEVIAAIAPSANRWLERQWDAQPERIEVPRADSERRLREPVPIIVAASRPNPITRGEQRAMLVASGGWMLSYIADVTVPIGGERTALMNPAHHELMLASVAWLAGMDDLIAQSPTTQEVARLGEIGTAGGRFWTIFILGGLPVGCLLMGLGVWMVRRR